MFSLCLHGKQSNCFPGKHELYMYSNPVFLEYRDHPQQWEGVSQIHEKKIASVGLFSTFRHPLDELYLHYDILGGTHVHR